MSIDELLPVDSSAALKYSPGDFGAKIEEGKLLLPPPVYEVLASHEESRLEYAYEIICAFENKSYDFRGDVAGALGWSKEEVDTAYQKLFRQTYRSIPQTILKWTGREEDARKLSQAEKTQN